MKGKKNGEGIALYLGKNIKYEHRGKWNVELSNIHGLR